MAKRLDLTGQRFGRLIVIKFSHSHKRRSYWFCKCDCGVEKIINGGHMKNGHTKSCGCYNREENLSGKRRLKHGQGRSGNYTPEYRAWILMRRRCNNKNSMDYPEYGGRGIIVCQRWMDSFENFFEDMGKKPSAKHSLDRYPDVNGSYEPSNCRWATEKEQARNTRRNVWLEYNGEKIVLAEFLERTKVDRSYFRKLRQLKTMEGALAYLKSRNRI